MGCDNRAQTLSHGKVCGGAIIGVRVSVRCRAGHGISGSQGVGKIPALFFPPSFTRTHALLSLSHTHKHTRTLTPHLREKGLRMLALNSNPLKLSPTVCANKTLAGRNKKQNIKCPMNNNLSKDLGLNGSSRLKESNPDFSVER